MRCFLRFVVFTIVVIGGFSFIYEASAGQLNDYNPWNVDIPDNTGGHACSDLLLFGAQSNAVIMKVKVYYEIRHPYPGDLDVWLTFYDGGWQDYYLYHHGDLGGSDDIVETRDNLHRWDGFSPNQEWFLCAKDWVSSNVGYIDFFELWVTYNVPPNQPSNPDPYDGESDVSTTTDLDWDCSDPDGDVIYYTVYFEKNDPIPDIIIKNNSTGSYADPGNLDYGAHYYWQVKADDHKGGVTWGLVWDFYTEEAVIDAEIVVDPIPDIVAGGSISIDYTVTNTGNIPHSFGIGCEIRQGGEVVEPVGSQFTPVVGVEGTYSDAFDFYVPCDWFTGTYTARVAAWSGQPGSSEWLDSYDRSFNIEAQPEISFDGRLTYHSYSGYLAYPLDDTDGNIHMYSFSSQSLENVTESLPVENAMNGHISPDGSKLVFMGIPEGVPRTWTLADWPLLEIYKYDMSRHELFRLTANSEADEDPKFSPGGKKIVFKRAGQLCLMNTDGSGVEQITNSAREKSGPNFSPDGSVIAFWYDLKSSADIGLMQADVQNSDFVLFGETNIQEMYPIFWNNDSILYSKWEYDDPDPDPPNPPDDIYVYSRTNGTETKLGSSIFNLGDVDDADAFPISNEMLGFSSTRLGNGYDVVIGNPIADMVYCFSGINSIYEDLGGWYSPYEYARSVELASPIDGEVLHPDQSYILQVRAWSDGTVWSGANPRVILEGLDNPYYNVFQGLHDDGLSGDATAGDGLYSLQISVPEEPGEFMVKATAISLDNGLENHLESEFPVIVTIVEAPQICNDPSSLTNSCQEGQNAPNQSFEVWNCGGGTLSYSISDDVGWLSCTPTSGTSTGEHDQITVQYSTSGLSPGSYSATVTISDPNASNNPQTISVSLEITTDVVEDADEADLTINFNLSQNYPNPFNPETVIEYIISKNCQVEISIYNLVGQKVRTLLCEYQNAGEKKSTWDGRDNQGNELGSGIYFYRLQAGDFCQTKKMVLLR
jgi:hypothetical protein